MFESFFEHLFEQPFKHLFEQSFERLFEQLFEHPSPARQRAGQHFEHPKFDRSDVDQGVEQLSNRFRLRAAQRQVHHRERHRDPRAGRQPDEELQVVAETRKPSTVWIKNHNGRLKHFLCVLYTQSH
jgi:hypothetical protein